MFAEQDNDVINGYFRKKGAPLQLLGNPPTRTLVVRNPCLPTLVAAGFAVMPVAAMAERMWEIPGGARVREEDMPNLPTQPCRCSSSLEDLAALCRLLEMYRRQAGADMAKLEYTRYDEPDFVVAADDEGVEVTFAADADEDSEEYGAGDDDLSEQGDSNADVFDDELEIRASVEDDFRVVFDLPLDRDLVGARLRRALGIAGNWSVLTERGGEYHRENASISWSRLSFSPEQVQNWLRRR